MAAKRQKPADAFVIVMGTAGTGKSEIGRRLAAALGCDFIEADLFHTPENVEKMREGKGLTDADREPWLHAVCSAALDRSSRPVVIACSALKRRYRDLIRGRLGDVRLVFLDGTRYLTAARLGARKGHFASTSLLDSQLQTLERPGADEAPVVLDIAQPPETLVATALHKLASLEVSGVARAL
uniref:gluconokinase n=1 Tax=uncultured Rhizobium sp. TaxID=155567 RepID=UPI0026347E01|nr:gluconokinase [uncultured Rhizobium sp.]